MTEKTKENSKNTEKKPVATTPKKRATKPKKKKTSITDTVTKPFKYVVNQMKKL